MKFFQKSADGFLSAMMMAENALLAIFTELPLLRFFWCRAHGKRQKSREKAAMTLSSFPCAQMLKTNTRLRARLCKRTLTVTANAR